MVFAITHSNYWADDFAEEQPMKLNGDRTFSDNKTFAFPTEDPILFQEGFVAIQTKIEQEINLRIAAGHFYTIAELYDMKHTKGWQKKTEGDRYNSMIEHCAGANFLPYPSIRLRPTDLGRASVRQTRKRN